MTNHINNLDAGLFVDKAILKKIERSKIFFKHYFYVSKTVKGYRIPLFWLHFSLIVCDCWSYRDKITILFKTEIIFQIGPVLSEISAFNQRSVQTLELYLFYIYLFVLELHAHMYYGGLNAQDILYQPTKIL